MVIKLRGQGLLVRNTFIKVISKKHKRKKTRKIEEKEKINRSARRIKPPGIFVNEDLAQETLDKIEEQRPMFEEERRNGKIAAYFVPEGWLLKRELASQLSSFVVLMYFSIL